MKSPSTLLRESAHCLHLELPESIANDVQAKVEAVINELDAMREVLTLVFRDTHSAGTMHFNRDTVGTYTAERVREVLGIDEKWLERDRTR